MFFFFFPLEFIANDFTTKVMVKSNKKRQCEMVERSPKKCQRRQATKITDLNDDCLEKIFKSFDIQNLFDVAVSNEWLRPAANAAYTRQFGAYKVRLYDVHTIQNACKPIYGSDIVLIHDLKTCLQFLRCFGSSITHLAINYRRSDSKRYDHVHQYINKYCSESLITVQFKLKPSFPIEHFVKPFVNVQSIQMFGCDLDEEFQRFFAWFPNVQNLKINGVDIVHRFVNATPPQLEHLTININGNECANVPQQFKCVADLLKSSRQLQSLIINVFNTKTIQMNSLLNWIKENQSISKLVVSADFDPKRVNTLEIKRLAREHPLLVELDLQPYQFTTGLVMTIIRLLTSLKKFIFRVQDSRVHDNIALKLDEGWQQSTYNIINSIVTLNHQN